MILSQRGAGGGSVLADSKENISLRKVYEAVNDDQELLPRYRGIGGEVAEVLGAYIDEFSKKAEDPLMDELERISGACSLLRVSHLTHAGGRIFCNSWQTVITLLHEWPP